MTKGGEDPRARGWSIVLAPDATKPTPPPNHVPEDLDEIEVQGETEVQSGFDLQNETDLQNEIDLGVASGILEEQPEEQRARRRSQDFSRTVVDVGLSEAVLAELAIERRPLGRSDTLPGYEDDAEAVDVPTSIGFELDRGVMGSSPVPVVEEELTRIDAAAAIGIAPEPGSGARDAGSLRDMVRSPLIAGGAVREIDGRRVRSETPAPNETDAPIAQLGVEQGTRRTALGRSKTLMERLPKWLAVSTLFAKIIPLLVLVFVVLALMMAVLPLLETQPSLPPTEHVNLRILPIGSAPSSTPADGTGHGVGEGQGEATSPEIAPKLRIETDPPGLLIVHDRKLLGQTPYSLPLPFPGTTGTSARFGVELTSPYFETWIGEPTRAATGDYFLSAQLKRK